MNRPTTSLLRGFPVLAMFLLLLAGSCSSGGCFDNGSAIPLAQFRNSADGRAVALTGVEIYGLGAPNDSLLLQPTQSASQIYLPMRSQYDSTAWCLAYPDLGTEPDTVVFRYISEPYFASEECGAFYQYRITEVKNTTHMLDSVAVLDSLITNADAVRIAFYYTLNPQQGDDE